MRDHDQSEPFFAWVSYPDRHHSFDLPEPWSRKYHPDEVDISSSHARGLDVRLWWHRAALEYEPLGKTERQRILRREYSRIEPQTDQQLREITAKYYGEISFIDDGIGRILETLENTGQADNTIIVFTSDHGELLGDHGLYLKGPTHYEGLLYVALMVSGPGTREGHVVQEPVSTLVLAPTFYDMAGIAAPQQLQGQSLMPFLRGEDVIRDFAYNEWNMQPSRAGIELDLRCVRTRDAKLTVDKLSGAGELYDLANDPDEMVNRFNDPGASALQAELTDMLAARPGPLLEQLPDHEA